MFRIGFLSLALLALSACGGSSSSPGNNSCNGKPLCFYCDVSSTQGQCWEFWMNNALPGASVSSLGWDTQCTNLSGTVANSCSTTNLIGHCAIAATASSGYTTYENIYYYSPLGGTLSNDQSTCNAMNQSVGGATITTTWTTGG